MPPALPLALYRDGQSIVHRCHPIVKVIGLLCFFVCAFVFEHPLYLLTISAVITLLIFLAGVSANLSRFRILFFFIFVFTSLIWSLSYRQGTPIPGLVFLSVTYEGLLFGLGMSVKLSTFLATSILFLSTTRVEEFAFALTTLGVPYRMSFALTLAFRLVPLFLEAAFTVIQAQRCRGLDLYSGHVLERVRHYVLVLIPVFMGALRRADQMAIALEVRGFNSGRPRTFAPRASWRVSDSVALLVVVVITGVYVSVWRAGYGRIAPG
jgi:energy-coupling factor transport system permease protein